MGFISFRDWIQARESSAFTRLRRDAALGLKPPIPGASVHSRSTAHPFEVEKLGKKRKKKRKKKKLKVLVDPINEAKKDDTPPKDPKVDAFLNAIGALKHDVDALKDVVDKDKSKPKPPEKPDKEDEKEKEKDEKDPNKKGEFSKYVSAKEKESEPEEDQRQKDVLKPQGNLS
jgi:hypothetical protein